VFWLVIGINDLIFINSTLGIGDGEAYIIKIQLVYKIRNNKPLEKESTEVRITPEIAKEREKSYPKNEEISG
jgi:hypothetical protein